MKNRIDEIFKAGLKNSVSPYSPDLWGNIEAELFPKQRNRHTGLWLMLLGILFLVPVFLLKDMDSKQQKYYQESEPLQNLAPGVAYNEANKGNLGINDASYLSKTEEFKSSSFSSDFINNRNPQSQDHIKLDSKPTIKLDVQDIENTRQAVNFSSSPTNRIGKESNVFRIINTSKNKKNNKILGTESNVRFIGGEYRSLNKLPIMQPGFVFTSSPYAITTDYCDEKKISPNKYYSEIYAGIGFAPKSYESNQAFSDYQLLKDDSESTGISFNAGFSVGYQFDSKFLLEGGFEYDQYNYNIDYAEREMTSIIITIDTIVTTGGDIVIQKDTTVVENFSLKHERLKHELIEIPLLAGYEFNLNHRLSLAIKTGIAFNIYSQSSGYILNPEGIAVNVGSDGLSSENSYYKSSFGISIPFRASVYYRMSPEIDLFARAGLRYYPGSITQTEFPVREKIYYNNLNFGIRVQI